MDCTLGESGVLCDLAFAADFLAGAACGAFFFTTAAFEEGLATGEEVAFAAGLGAFLGAAAGFAGLEDFIGFEEATLADGLAAPDLVALEDRAVAFGLAEDIEDWPFNWDLEASVAFEARVGLGWVRWGAVFG